MRAAEEARDAAEAGAEIDYTNPLGLVSSTSLPSLVPQTPLVETPLSPTNGSFPPDFPFPPSPVPGRRHSFTMLPRLSMVGNIPLPEQTEEEIESISGPSSVVGDEDYQNEGNGGESSAVSTPEWGDDEIQDAKLIYQPLPSINFSDDNIQDLSFLFQPSSPITSGSDTENDENQGRTCSSITEMEEEEASAGEGVGAFHAEPLVLKNGVAVLEESVEEHEADVITQF